MKLHGNHRTCPSSRRLICRRVLEEGWTLAAAAEAAGCSERTAAKWVRRFQQGDRELLDRSSRPHSSPRQLPADRVRAIEALRRLWMTAAEIAELLSLPLSSVSLWLKRIGLGRRSRLAPPEPPNRYERRHAGELVHVDSKRLRRISARGAGHRVLGHRHSQYGRRVEGRMRRLTGYEYVHVMVDDHSRLAERGVRVQAVMTDNGSCYVAHAYRAAVRALGLGQLRIKPGRPRTNGRPSASARCCSTSGRMDASTAARPNGQRRSRSSSGATTASDPTAPSANRRRPRG